MKRSGFNGIIALLLLAALTVSMVFSLAPSASADGDSEVIYIKTAEDFAKLAEECALYTWSRGKLIVLEADISLADAALTVIPTFGGTFDGNGHTVSGVRITGYASPAGLFAVLQEGGVVKNLKVSGSVIPSGEGENVGGIAGENYGTVLRCTFTGSVSGGTNVGGIAGQMEPHIVRNISESTLAKLEEQLDELDEMLTEALDDADAGAGAVTSRLNRIADYLESASGAADGIRTYGSASGTVTGSGGADGGGSVAVTPSQAEAAGSGGASIGAGAAAVPGGGAAGGSAASGGEIHAGLTQGGAEGEYHSSADGNISASAQLAVTTDLSGLSSAVAGMSGQMRLLNGSFTCTQNGEDYLYTISLDEDGMKAVAYAIAPETEGMDVIFDSGRIQVTLSGEEIRKIAFSLSGCVQVVLTNAEVSMEAGIDFAEEATDMTIPEAEKTALIK